MTLLARGEERLAALPRRQRISLLTGGALLVAAILLVTWYIAQPAWRVLFSGQEARDVQTVSQELAAAGIKFRTTADGSGVEVPAEVLDKARMEIAAKGMPQTGRLGFELFDKPNWVGSEFDEKVNYQRALEGELEHTISTLSAVGSARVHLVLPAESMFSQEQKTAKAAVTLKLKHPELAPDQVDAIRRLVAGSVESLTPDNVTLVDADGRVNLKGTGRRGDQADTELRMEGKLVALLEPLVGIGNVRAIVNADYDEGTEERTDEVDRPDASTALSREKMSDGSEALALPPLLRRNQEAELPTFGKRRSTLSPTISQGGAVIGVSRHSVHRQDAPGRLRRLTTAVLVNDKRVLEGFGKSQKVTWEPRSREDMARLEELAEAAVGFDRARGDQVTVENVSFLSDGPEEVPATAVSTDERPQGIAKFGSEAVRGAILAVFGLLVVAAVWLPVSRQLMARLRSSGAFEGPAKHRLNSDGATEMRAGSGVLRRLDGQAKISADVVAETILRKPMQSKRALENWINGPQGVS